MSATLTRVAVYLGLLLPSAHAQSIISTFAGTDFIFPSSGIPASAAPLGSAYGLAMDPDGNIYIGDCGNHQIFKVDTAGIISILAGTGVRGSAPDGPVAGARLNCPSHLTFDRNGDLLFVTTFSQLRKITRDGRIVSIAGTAQFIPNSPDGIPAARTSFLTNGGRDGGLAVDNAGNIYFSDFSSDRVRKIGLDGLVTTVAGTGVRGFSGDGGPGNRAQLNGPAGLSIGPDGTIYIADFNNSRVRAVSPDGIIRTFAGNGASNTTSGDGAQALAAGVPHPGSLFVEPSGSVVITQSFPAAVRRVSPSGVISTIVQASFSLSANGANPANTRLDLPSVIVRDLSGNLLFSDSGNSVIRKVEPSGRVTNFAGNGNWRRSPDSTSAITAWLSSPNDVAISPCGLVTFTDTFDNGTVRQVNSSGQLIRFAGALTNSRDASVALNRNIKSPAQLAFDPQGNLYVAVRSSCAVGKITPDGKYSVVAGNGSAGFNGDGGPATQANLCPSGIALSPAGELYIADSPNNRIRKVGTDGVIRTIAGTGSNAFSGDGGPATAAQLNNPTYLLLDPSGDLFFSDSNNSRVRKINAEGIISTIAGGGNPNPGFSGDNGPATQAQLNSPQGLARDSVGNIYIADTNNNRVRVVRTFLDGSIVTIAGGRPFLADGVSPLNSSLNRPTGIAIDSAGRIYIADTGNDRIRVITNVPPTFEASPASITLTNLPFELSLTSSISGLAFSASASAPWLTAVPASGTLPARLQVAANTAGLAPGQYSATVTVTVPLADPATRQIAVNLNVQDVQPPKLSIGGQSLSFAFQKAASPSSITLSLSNQGGGVINYTASAGDWLDVSPASGQISAGATQSLTLTATPETFAEGTYSKTLSIFDGASTTKIPVTMSITRPQGKLLISQSGLTFTAVQGGGAPASQSFGILNEGTGEMPYESKATTLAGGNWLTLNNPSGRVSRPLQDIGFIEVVPNPRGLTAGDYYAEIRITAPGINSPQLVTVLLKVLPPGANPGPEVRPTGLIFIGPPGSTPAPEDIRVANLLNRVTTYASSSLTLDGARWISHLPAAASINPDEPRRILVQPDFNGITPGIKRGVLTLVFDDGSIRTVSILSVIPDSSPASNKLRNRELASCASPTLRNEFISLSEGGAITVGQPVSIEVKVVDDCGNLLQGFEKNANSAVYAKFSNGDPDLRLVPIGSGVWANTWRPTNAASGTVTVSAVSVYVQGLTLQAGRTDRGVRVSSGANVPIVRQGALVHSASQRGDAPVAPGTLVSIYGSDLAGSPRSTAVPLPTDVDGTQVLLAGQPLPILYSSATQINAQIPYTLPVNTSHQIVIRRNATLSVPESFTVASTQPGIFTANQQGTGQGVVMGPDQLTVATPSAPAEREKAIVIYCTGLGAVTPDVTIGIPAPSAPLSQSVDPVTVDLGGKPAPVFFSGLTPGFTGLYQVNALVPADAPTGDSVNLTITTGGQTSNIVTIAIR